MAEKVAQMSNEELSESERRWRVEHRNQIQLFLLGIYEGERKSAGRGDEAESLAGLIVGAAFALWRAVFLVTEAPRSREEVASMSVQVLEKLVDDNAFTFANERTFERWCSGFYLNCACFHIDEALRRAASQGMVVDAQSYSDARGKGIRTPPTVQWERAYELLERLNLAIAMA